MTISVGSTLLQEDRLPYNNLSLFGNKEAWQWIVTFCGKKYLASRRLEVHIFFLN